MIQFNSYGFIILQKFTINHLFYLNNRKNILKFGIRKTEQRFYPFIEQKINNNTAKPSDLPM